MSYSERRTDPDALLEIVQEEEARLHRGKLKIFFGGCAGTGKTYAMLAAASAQLREGIDVVAGIVETHGRTETQKMLQGIPILPMIQASHKDMSLREFNLEAAKARKPAIILMDELAHTNAPGSIHAKRWQDVEELLASGINVYTTLNVQHLESLSDVVAGVTGVRVKETVPDSIFDTADDIVLVDITADELLKRLNEGKVYIADMAKARAAENFFKKNNIIALRELALRRTSERVDAQMTEYNLREGIRDVAPVADKVMVCIGPDLLSAKLVRSARRMASSLKAPLIAAYVENARHYHLSDTGKASVEATMRMVERLGGKTIILQGDNAVDELIAYAQRAGITKIIVGKSAKSRWRDIILGSLVDKIIRKSGAIDVYIVTGQSGNAKTGRGRNTLIEFSPRLYIGAGLVITACTLAGMGLRNIAQPIDQALLYLTGNVIVASRLGRGPSILYALLAAACFNFFFIPPLYTFEIYDSSYWMTLFVMLVTSLVITSYATRLRLQATLSRRREHHTQTLYALTRNLASTRGHRAISEVTAKHVEEVFDTIVTIWMPDSADHLSPVIGNLPEREYVKEMAVLQWCFDHQRIAGRDTTTMPSAHALHLPLIAISGTLGVMALLPKAESRHFSLEELSSLETIASLFASALERANSAEQAEKSKVEAESEKLRNILLSTVSHDLRTPLASITGAASSIVMDAAKLPLDTIIDLSRSIHHEADRLSRIVTNLLDVTSLEAGTVKLHLEPYFIEEVIGSTLSRMEPLLARHTIVTQAEPELPMVIADGLMIEQVLTNLIENAIKYTPPGSTITIHACCREDKVLISVADNGPGITPGDEKNVFNKFFTTAEKRAQKGTGLGLAICYGVIRAHQGTIWVENRQEGGAAFYFTLPSTPALPREIA